MELVALNAAVTWIAVIANLILTFAVVRRVIANRHRAPREEGEQLGLPKGVTAPAFEGVMVDGTQVSNADYHGRQLALLFISPNCEPCRRDLPRYQRLGTPAKVAGTELVLVSTGETEATRALLLDLNVTLPVILTPPGDNSFAANYKIPGTPAYCLIGPTGVVESAGLPAFDWGEWAELVRSWESGERFTQPASEPPVLEVMHTG